jgi:hypothetical protein
MHPRTSGLLAAPFSLALLLSAQVASAASVVINNGLAPPNPANVINASNSFPGIGQNVDVQNVGCNVNLIDPCPSPGAPTSVALVTGGVVGSALAAHETSSITMSGGMAGGLGTWDSSSATMSGGSVSDLDAMNSSAITMSGGSVGGELAAFDMSSVTVSGGTINANVHAGEAASLTISGGNFTGSLLGVDAGSTTAAIKLRGGTGFTSIEPDNGTITIFGGNFEVGGLPVGYGPLQAQSGTLTGILGSGDSIDVGFSQGGAGGIANGSIVLAFAPIPEPGTALLVASGIAALTLRRAREVQTRRR